MLCAQFTFKLSAYILDSVHGVFPDIETTSKPQSDKMAATLLKKTAERILYIEVLTIYRVE